MKRKGQIIVEYSVLIGLALVFAIIISGFLLIQSSRNVDERHRVAIDSQLTRMQNEILSAHTSKDGYFSIVEFQPPYLGVNMNMTLQPPILLIRTDRSEGMIYLPEFIGTIETDNGNIMIRNIEGIVMVGLI